MIANLIEMMIKYDELHVLDYILYILQSGMITIADINNITIHVYTIGAMH